MGSVVYFLLINTRVWLVALIAYFCGCFNGAVIVSKYILRDDVRNHGSGNAGLTNFFRTFGGPLTFVVILTDVLKAVVAIALAIWIGGGYDPRLFPEGPLPNQEMILVLFKYWASLFCLLGHMFPCMFHFKGGKGILSGGAIALMLDWRIALIVWVGFLLFAVLTRYVSLGSCWAGGTFPIVSWFIYHDLTITLLGALIGALILFMHRGNIQRLLAGTESKFTLQKK